MAREQVNYGKIVNFDKESKEITVLDYVFKHSDDFKGATGTTFSPISKDEYDSILDEYLNDPQAVSEYWNDAIGEPLTYDQVVAISESEEEVMQLCGGLDDSYSEKWDYLREELNLDEDEAYVFTCTGGGRCFDENFQGNVNEELSKIIRKYEKK